MSRERKFIAGFKARLQRFIEPYRFARRMHGCRARGWKLEWGYPVMEYLRWRNAITLMFRNPKAATGDFHAHEQIRHCVPAPLSLLSHSPLVSPIYPRPSLLSIKRITIGRRNSLLESNFSLYFFFFFFFFLRLTELSSLLYYYYYILLFWFLILQLSFLSN